ncbi:MAG: OmpA family protein [Saprospiraceae bacterium]|nr:OmpA family protein [Saprospiraceae bacterium]MCF8249298.1 OmpA family protein [Saprospiraceae bacterium]MCF8279719.1 OmpA family protein [Bacteroidales bacterium]MCF8311425.1 OmpA family protein [Saprospiraceae bacterium]MCF8439917.1 OmpA family protein [Saprospiraceae bacterium]
MSKLLPSISGVACFIWVTGWTWIFSEGKNSETDISNQTPINILIDSSQYQVQHPFSFKFSEATPIIAENLHPILKSVAHRLVSQPSLRLVIVGICSPTEANNSSFPNLGVARAESIKSLLTTIGADGDKIETTGILAENLFEVDGHLTGLVYFNFTKLNAENQPLVAENPKEEPASSKSKFTSFFYEYGNYKVEKHHLGLLKSLQTELREDSDRSVVLSGYSTPEEEAESTRINLAEMRALAIRRYLVDHGVRRSQIEVKTKPSMAQSSSEMSVSVELIQK